MQYFGFHFETWPLILKKMSLLDKTAHKYNWKNLQVTSR